jgi:hypothetical protein
MCESVCFHLPRARCTCTRANLYTCTCVDHVTMHMHACMQTSIYSFKIHTCRMTLHKNLCRNTNATRLSVLRMHMNEYECSSAACACMNANQKKLCKLHVRQQHTDIGVCTRYVCMNACFYVHVHIYIGAHAHIHMQNHALTHECSPNAHSYMQERRITRSSQWATGATTNGRVVWRWSACTSVGRYRWWTVAEHFEGTTCAWAFALVCLMENINVYYLGDADDEAKLRERAQALCGLWPDWVKSGWKYECVAL